MEEDQILKQVQQEAEEAGRSESPTEEPQTEEQSPQEAVETQPEEVQASTEEGDVKTEERGQESKNSGRSAQHRIKELVRERKSVQSENADLKRQLEEYTRAMKQGFQTPGFNPNQDADMGLQPGQELSIEDYNRHIKQRAAVEAESIVQAEFAKRDLLDRINREATEAMNSYTELNPDSETFDGDLSDTITETVAEMVRLNPSISVKATVDRLMRPYKKIVSKVETEATKKAAQQVSETAMRPTSQQPQEVADEDLSWEEIEKKVGVVRDY